ncbi:PREDICTED: GMP reductase 1 [Lepidothrix coronata]|uniref:GMP reductase n=1 Tax=Lepidothrix coronata TaxID=321398 RepID=A0A6J0GPU9_9PASS|nr:PREDICTED: GMP reductase 1 [Lepidothrix coronata]
MPRVDADIKLDFKDVLLRPKRSSLKSRSEVDLTRTFTFRNSKQTYTGIPIIVANMDTVGTFEMAVVMAKHAMFTAIHKHYSLEEWKLFAANHPECLEHVAASSGSGKADLDKLKSILEAIPLIRYICLDVANGYSEHFVEFVKCVRALFPHHTIMAGNVVTGEMVEELILSGADIIKVGIGPGQRTLLDREVVTCSSKTDGGCSCPGDVAKAFGAGADFVMLGGMFAGHDQCAGEIMERNGKKVKLFYGMSSDTAMKKHAGGVAEYRLGVLLVYEFPASPHAPFGEQKIQAVVPSGKLLFARVSETVTLPAVPARHSGLMGFVGLVCCNYSSIQVFPNVSSCYYGASEGRTVEVPYRGDVENTILDILGGLRSTCTYVGAAKLKELSRRTTFIRVTQQHSQVFS